MNKFYFEILNLNTIVLDSTKWEILIDRLFNHII
jgi:hypothetical protein